MFGLKVCRPRVAIGDHAVSAAESGDPLSGMLDAFLPVGVFPVGVEPDPGEQREASVSGIVLLDALGAFGKWNGAGLWLAEGKALLHFVTDDLDERVRL